ncbi:MAG: UbiD family decarboxylase [Desulfobacterales bacterium]|nr:UbiD family decarboxylase [Desulfobacterales bacterium]
MPERSLRAFMEQLANKGELIQIEEEVDPKFEIPGVLRILDEQGGPAAVFDSPKGYSVKAVGNILGKRNRLAMAMDIEDKELIEEYLRRKKHPIPSKLVSDGPVKEVVIKHDIDILRFFPVATYSEKDSNPYLTSGVVLVKNPVSGNQTMGLHRMQVLGQNRLTVLLLNPPVSLFYQQKEERNEPLEVAIALGLDPLFMFSTVAWMPEGGDKLELVGSLYGEPVEMVQAETVDLNVPAHAEIVLEGKILPHIREKDGPFGESSGYYVPYESPVVEIETVTHRENPYFQVLCPCSNEAFSLLVSWEAEMLKKLRGKFPEVRHLNLVPETVGAHAVVSVKKASRGMKRQMMTYFLADNASIKRVVVVDDDVDVYNQREVEWALATRFQADMDLVVLSDLIGFPLDPSTKADYLTAKMGLDATKPIDDDGKFEKICVPSDVLNKMQTLLDRYCKKT